LRRTAGRPHRAAPSLPTAGGRGVELSPSRSG
jgi:hypothetical protein